MKRNYNDPQYKLWRKKIRARDHHTCRWPGCSNKTKTHVHHILKWSDYPGLRYHTNNGILLCQIHHDLIKNDEESYAPFFLKVINSINNK